MAHGTATVSPLLQATRTIPIVFPVVSDPVGTGLVDSLARPGGNATGFLTFEYSLSGKWLELLKQIAPNVTRAAILRDSTIASNTGQFGALASVAKSLRTELTPISLQDPAGIERAVGTFAHAPNGGLIVTTSGLAMDNCDVIVALAAHTSCPRFTTNAPSSLPAVSSPMDLVSLKGTATLRLTLIASSRVRSPPIFRSRRRPNTN